MDVLGCYLLTGVIIHFRRQIIKYYLHEKIALRESNELDVVQLSK